jgi:hypothetical protein
MESALMKRLALAAFFVGSAFAAPTQAHHSFSMFDYSKDVALTGAVKDWQWTSPHAWLVLVVSDDQGKTVEWNIEAAAPEVLRRKGWVRDMVKIGDHVTIHMHPLKSGASGGTLTSVATPTQTYN